MGESTKRIRIHYAAQASSAGSRWSRYLLTALASTTDGKTTAQAIFQRSERYYYGSITSAISTIEQAADGPEAAVSLVNRWANNPLEALSLASRLNQRDSGNLQQQFATSKIVGEIDGSADNCPVWAQCGKQAKSGTLPISLALGQALEEALVSGNFISDEIGATLAYFLDNVPFQVGHWGAFKRIFKLLEARQDAAAIFAHALARVDANSRHGRRSRISVEDLSMLAPFFPEQLASDATLGYLSRRGRRYFRTQSKTNKSAYCETAFEFLRTADRLGHAADISQRWILADLLFARGVRDKSHGRGAVELPETDKRYRRRWDRSPRLWNTRTPLVSELWKNVSAVPEIQIWAFNVLKSTRNEIPRLSRSGLKLALLSPTKAIQTLACGQVADAPRSFQQLDSAAAIAFLSFSTNKQLRPVLESLDSQADSTVVQQAVFDFASEHGLHNILRGDTVANPSSREKALFSFTLRHIRNRLNDAETLNLALYVGETDRFRSLALWEETFKSLPLKILIELRLQLPRIGSATKAAIDAACHHQALSGEQDDTLAMALVHSPSRRLRELAWEMLTAGESLEETIEEVWKALAGHAIDKTGVKHLQECLYDANRLSTLVQHKNAAHLLGTVALALAKAESPATKRALGLLANTKDAAAVASCLEHFSNALPQWGWVEEKTLLTKLTSRVPGVIGLVWQGLGEEKYVPIAEAIQSIPSINRLFFDAIEPSDLLRLNAQQSSLFRSVIEASPARLVRDRAFAIAAATCPEPSIASSAITLLEARDAVSKIYMQLFESRLPSAMAAAERFVRQLPPGDRLTRTLISICDSGVKEVRRIGISLLDELQGEYDSVTVYSALAEHKATDITEAVARHVLAGGEVRGRGVRRFENRVLRTRRHGRKTKDLVKEHISTKTNRHINQRSLSHILGTERIQSLIAMATGVSKRDREWALQELVRLEGLGIKIPQLSVSRTS